MLVGFIDNRNKKTEYINSMISSLKVLSNLEESIYTSECFSCALLSRKEHLTENYFEDSGYLVLLSGYILNLSELLSKYEIPISEDTSIAVVIKKLYSEKHLGFIPDLNGVFSILIFDKEKKILHLVTDKLGMKPLFYYFHDGLLVFSSEVKGLLRHPDVPKNIDWEAWSEYFYMLYICTDSTPFKDIKRVSRASVLSYVSGKITIKKYSDILDTKIDHNLTFDSVISDVPEKIEGALDKFDLNDDLMQCCPISGGYDSRLILSMLAPKIKDALLTVTTVATSGDFDVNVASKITSNLGVKHMVIPHKSGLYKNYLVKKIYASDGMYQEGLWIFSMLKVLRECDIVWDGIAGDVILKGLFITKDNLKFKKNSKSLANQIYEEHVSCVSPIKKYFSPGYKDKIRFTKGDFFKRVFSGYEVDNSLSSLFIKMRTSRNIVSAVWNFLGRVSTPRFLFLEEELFKYSLSIPEKYKIFDHIYLKSCEKIVEDFSSLPTTNDRNLKKKFMSFLFKIFIKLRLMKFIKMFYYSKFITKGFGTKFDNEDINYIKKLSDSLIFPDYINRELFLTDVGKLGKRFNRGNHFLLNILEFLIWYNLFVVNNDMLNSKLESF